MNKLVHRSFLNALGTVAYVAIVGTIMENAERVLGSVDNNMLAPVAFLTLFVLSAAVTASLVVGKPALMYLNGQKAEAVRLFLYTVGWLAIFTVIIFGLISIR